jgi:hypothetical protein
MIQQQAQQIAQQMIEQELGNRDEQSICSDIRARKRRLAV